MPDHETQQASPLPTVATRKADEVEDAFYDGKSPGDLHKLVNTRWQIGYTSALDAKRAGLVVPRSSTSALFVDDLRIQPKDPSGLDTSRYEKVVNGVGIAGSGAAHIGTFPLPTGLGGAVTANVAYGTRPSFDFSIQTQDRGVIDRDQRDHKQLANQLGAALDDFVQPGEAQRVLDQLLAQQFPGKTVTGTIKQSKPPAKNQATTTLDYAPLSGARLFDLAVEIPTQTDKDVQTSSVTKTDENTHGDEQTHGKTDETEGTVSSQQETALVSSMTTTLKAGMKNLATTVRSGGFANGFARGQAGGADTSTTAKAGFKADFSGDAKIGLGELPLIGKLASGALSFKINPDFSTDVTMFIKGTNTDETTVTSKLDWAQTNELAGWVETHTESLVTNSWKTVIVSAIRTKASQASGNKKTEGQKTGGASGLTETKGTIVSLQTGSIRLVENKK